MSSTKKKSISKKHADREKSENQTLNRVYYVFLLGLAAECWLFLTYRMWAASTLSAGLKWFTALQVLMWLGLAALVLGAAGAYFKRQNQKLRKILSWTAGVGAFFALSGWIITFFPPGVSTGVTVMCILVPIAAVLALVYLLYQHECALCTVVLSGAMFSVWLRGASAASERWGLPVMAGCIVVALALGAAIFLTSKAQKDEGKLWKLRVFSVECDYRIVYAVLAVAAAAMLLTAFLPAATYYLMWSLGVLLFAELVFYTTKLM
ncbi:MAG: hypothetical protein K2O45_09920 [Oscillospiraceae bacterium]|nr:hypothetical protein [Oscillospiraceae bacterium]